MATRQKTRLCVDDTQRSLNISKVILEGFGYTVSTARRGREGLEVFASNAIDAVILDYQMPGMNGGMVAAEMKKANSGVPVLMLSGCASVPEGALQLVDESCFLLTRSARQTTCVGWFAGGRESIIGRTQSHVEISTY